MHTSQHRESVEHPIPQLLRYTLRQPLVVAVDETLEPPELIVRYQVAPPQLLTPHYPPLLHKGAPLPPLLKITHLYYFQLFFVRRSAFVFVSRGRLSHRCPPSFWLLSFRVNPWYPLSLLYCVYESSLRPIRRWGPFTNKCWLLEVLVGVHFSHLRQPSLLVVREVLQPGWLIQRRCQPHLPPHLASIGN